MPEAAYSSIMTEAVAVFQDVKPFEAAIDDLLSAGFDHADIAEQKHALPWHQHVVEEDYGVHLLEARSQRMLEV